MVTPVPGPGLAVVGTSELVQEIDAAATEPVVADGGWFENLGALRCARCGDESIQYGKVDGNRLLDCPRGAFGTKASADLFNRTGLRQLSGAGQELERFALDEDALRVPTGPFRARVTCRFSGSDEPELKVELRTLGEPTRLCAGR